MLDRIKIAIGKFIAHQFERHGLRVVLADHENKDSARLDWYFQMYREPLTEASCQRALDFGRELAIHNDPRRAIDTIRALHPDVKAR